MKVHSRYHSRTAARISHSSCTLCGKPSRCPSRRRSMLWPSPKRALRLYALPEQVEFDVSDDTSVTDGETDDAGTDDGTDDVGTDDGTDDAGTDDEADDATDDESGTGLRGECDESEGGPVNIAIIRPQEHAVTLPKTTVLVKCGSSLAFRSLRHVWKEKNRRNHNSRHRNDPQWYARWADKPPLNDNCFAPLHWSRLFLR